ncbi:MAG: MoaD/ThiS family protein [Planctomycetes bacterium]|nr:MoaD/ThiS family protein [Planctomycetota bacterium]MCH9727000.1 MoaD/ThiS family protein [Planctomycetota bacterium]MCH9775210.1 MoaD/ThiS family protein [Planctomycetota bacterium]MCH9789195.1 MoaD/ThiS family protein [Planctomycetota bacterium]
MKIIVEFTAQVKKAAGVSKEEFEVSEGTSLQELLKEVAEQHGPSLKPILFPDSDELHPSILLFVSSKQVMWDEPLTLESHHVVTILSPISGG